LEVCDTIHFDNLVLTFENVDVAWISVAFGDRSVDVIARKTSLPGKLDLLFDLRFSLYKRNSSFTLILHLIFTFHYFQGCGVIFDRIHCGWFDLLVDLIDPHLACLTFPPQSSDFKESQRLLKRASAEIALLFDPARITFLSTDPARF